ncbi:MAG: transaldolase family protein, partial [bacterium]
GEGFADLIAKGARPQRVLWASTSTKNPAYPKVKYVDALVGPDTVDTIPLQTIHDYRELGQPKDRLTSNVQSARLALAQLEKLGYSLNELANTLEEDAVKKFVDPFNSLIASIESKRAKVTA